jgi:hypothetical protein
MKRREIKFVAGSVQLAPDRIEAAPALRKSGSAVRKRTARGKGRQSGAAQKKR